MSQIPDTAGFALLAGEAGFDPIEERQRTNVRGAIEAVFEEELACFLSRLRYDRGDGPAIGYRHGHRERQLSALPVDCAATASAYGWMAGQVEMFHFRQRLSHNSGR